MTALARRVLALERRLPGPDNRKAWDSYWKESLAYTRRRMSAMIEGLPTPIEDPPTPPPGPRPGCYRTDDRDYRALLLEKLGGDA